jgi:gas vesicle protein
MSISRHIYSTYFKYPWKNINFLIKANIFMNNTSKLLIVFAAGAVAGAAAGLLLAPAKGEDTRKKIVEAGKKVTNAVTDMLGAYKKETAGNEYVNSEES